MLRLGILTTHPIQYQVPWFRALACEPDISLRVFYAMLPDETQQGCGFGVAFRWDTPLLDGYSWEQLPNDSHHPAVTTFDGCDTPDIGHRLDTYDIDALIVNGWGTRSALQGLAACRRRGIPCLVRGESNLLTPRPFYKRLLHRLLLHQYAACLSIGQANRAFYLAHGIGQTRLFDTPYGVDNAWFQSRADSVALERTAIRSGWSLQPESLVVTFCGKFVNKKRPMDVLRAVHRVRADGANVQALMVGDGELRASCEAFARERYLPVTFTGFLNQHAMIRAYVACDALVLPSDAGETWGLVVNEAFACGRPAIISDCCGCAADMILPGQTGATFPCGDIGALSAHLRALARAPGLVLAQGQAAQAHTMGSYDIRHTVAGIRAALAFLKPDE